MKYLESDVMWYKPCYTLFSFPGGNSRQEGLACYRLGNAYEGVNEQDAAIQVCNTLDIVYCGNGLLLKATVERVVPFFFYLPKDVRLEPRLLIGA